LVIQVGKERRIEGDLSSRKEARRRRRYDRLPDAVVVRVRVRVRVTVTVTVTVLTKV
jgi:hypothetical protein